MVLGKVPDNPLIRDNRQGRVCRAVSKKVPDDPLVPDNPLIHDDYQGGVCYAVSRKVPDDSLICNDR